MYDYITIERSYACGGHAIATALAQKLGYKLYDHNVVVETCKRLDLPYNQVVNMDEHLPIKTPFRVPGDKYLSLEEKIFHTETDIIREAAKEAGCIFIGRCASAILRDKKCLKVFITASHTYRKDRAIQVEKIAPSEAESVMRQYDVRRSKYFTTYANAKWGSSDYFDMILNSEALGTDVCADVIAAAVKG